jgi:hypothetical protein
MRSIVVHELKTVNPFFDDIWEFRKEFEIRNNDREFLQGDLLQLREYDIGTNEYSGRELTCEVTYLPRDPVGLLPGYVVMGIRIIRRIA